MMALALMMAMATWAQTNIVVLSDTHVMGPGLLVNDGAAWQKELANDRKLFDYSQEVFDVLMETMLSEKPDMVLITGDLTKDGELLSHQYVAGQLNRLREAGIKTFVIPGNHDFGSKHALIFDGDQSSKAKMAEHGLSWDLLESIVTSIMTDTTNLGIEGRQDQTNDLTLAIKK
jgi:DNA repair exonuclease SbcCD nuclease subunit